MGSLPAAVKGNMQPITPHRLSGDPADVGGQHTLQTLILPDLFSFRE